MAVCTALERNCKLCCAEQASKLLLQLCWVLCALTFSKEHSFLVFLNSLQEGRVEKSDAGTWNDRTPEYVTD